MMLAYQPVRSLATVNMAINQGLSAARRILPIIDQKNSIIEKHDAADLIIKNGTIKFENVSFKYNSEEKEVLKSINIEIVGGNLQVKAGGLPTASLATSSFTLGTTVVGLGSTIPIVNKLQLTATTASGDFSGSFSGSFEGDGSGLTGLATGALSTIEKEFGLSSGGSVTAGKGVSLNLADSKVGLLPTLNSLGTETTTNATYSVPSFDRSRWIRSIAISGSNNSRIITLLGNAFTSANPPVYTAGTASITIPFGTPNYDTAFLKSSSYNILAIANDKFLVFANAMTSGTNNQSYQYTKITVVTVDASGNLTTVNCHTTKTVIDAGSNCFLYTGNPLVLNVRASDATWTSSIGTGKTIGNNSNVTVVASL